MKKSDFYGAVFGIVLCATISFGFVITHSAFKEILSTVGTDLPNLPKLIDFAGMVVAIVNGCVLAWCAIFYYLNRKKGN
jgi:hypothetical protein